MISLLQRVSFAQVEVKQTTIAKIQNGLLIFVGIENHDSAATIKKMSNKILHYRLFSDENKKMNCDVTQVSGEILLVSQFTLAANTSKGRRPSFSNAAAPDISLDLFNGLAKQITNDYQAPQLGEFGTDMQVSLCNDGPVTFYLQC